MAATDNRDQKASFSNYGPTTVHLGAPGVKILSIVGNGGYEYYAYSGTSMAAPHVSGAAALVLAGCPGLNTAALKSALLNNVDKISALATNTITGGRLNVNRALRACSGPFYVTASPSFRSVGRSKSTTFTVSVGSGSGFTGTVSLSASGLPSYTTASFSPASLTAGGSSTMTVTAGASTPLGTYTVTIKGTSGATTSTTTVTLEVANPDFSIAASPTSVLVNPGKSAGYSLSLDAKGSFASLVTLSVSGLPAGVTKAFSPASLTPPGTSTLTITTSSTTPEGLYTLTVTGTGGGLTRSKTVTLELRKPTFTLNVSPASVTITKPGTYALTSARVTAQYNFSGSVTISVSGMPAGGSVKYTGNPINVPLNGTGYANVQLYITSSTPVGTYTLTVTGTGGGVTKTTPVTLTVKTF